MERSSQMHRCLHWLVPCLAASLSAAMGQVQPDRPQFEVGQTGQFSVSLMANGEGRLAYDGGDSWYLRRLPLHGRLPDPVAMGGRVFSHAAGPHLALDATGGGILAWHWDQALVQLQGQLFRRNGTPAGGQLVLTELDELAWYSHLAMSGSGEFVVVWEDFPHLSLFARRFHADGQPMGPSFQVSDTLAALQPKVAMSASGEFVVAWYGAEVPQVPGIFARRYDINDQPLGPSFQVNKAELGGGITSLDVALNDAGVFSIGWTVVLGEAVFVRHFDESGPLHGEVRLNRDLDVNGSPTPFSLAMDASGRSVAFWTSRNDSDPQTVYGVLLTSAGLPAGGPFQPAPPSSPPSTLDDPDVAMTPEGDFLVMWHGLLNNTFGQRFTIDLPGQCSGPAAPVSITNVQLAGSDAILTLDDLNPPPEVTGYNIYRSTDPAAPREQWTLWDWDATDRDEETAGIQTLAREWTHFGTLALSMEYFEVVAYNSACPAEGPR